MIDWLRAFILVLVAPLRGLREVRDHSTLAQSGLVALVVHATFFFYLTWSYLREFIACVAHLAFPQFSRPPVC